MTKTKNQALKIAKIHVGSRIGDRIALIWTEGDAVYHVWIDTKTELVEDVLYKNPPDGTEYKSPKHFNTKKLSASSDRALAMLEEVLHVYTEEGLLAKFELEEAKELAAQKAAREERERQDAVKDAAPALLAALKEVEGLLSLTEQEKPGDRLNWSSNVRLAWHAAARAIAKVEGR